MTGNETGISFWVKGDASTCVLVRLEDHSGQTLQYHFGLTGIQLAKYSDSP